MCVCTITLLNRSLCLCASAVVLLIQTLSRPLRSPQEATPLVTTSPVTLRQVSLFWKMNPDPSVSGAELMSASLSQMRLISALSLTCAARHPDPLPVT